MNNIKIKNVPVQEFDVAIALVLDVFMGFEAPEYSTQGVETFRQFVTSDEFRQECIDGRKLFLGCYVNEILAGIIVMRDISHVCLLFVRKEFHRMGIATLLFNKVLDILKEQHPEVTKITVNSSPYGAKFYHAVGFTDEKEMQTTDGIKYIPMIYYI